MAPPLWRSVNCPSAHGLKKGPDSYLRSPTSPTINRELWEEVVKKFKAIADGRALAEAHGECHQDIPMSQRHSRQAAWGWQSSRRQLEPAQGTSRALPPWHRIRERLCQELRPEAAQEETTVFPKSCLGQLYTRDLARSALTPRTNLHTAQVPLEVIWASLPSGQQAGAYQLPFHFSFYFFSLLLSADGKQSPLSYGGL